MLELGTQFTMGFLVLGAPLMQSWVCGWHVPSLGLESHPRHMQAPAGPSLAAEDARSRADLVLFCLGPGAQSWNLPLVTRLAGGPLFTLSQPDPLSPAKPGTHFSLCILPDLRRTHGFTKWQVKETVTAFVILEYLQHAENHNL